VRPCPNLLLSAFLRVRYGFALKARSGQAVKNTQKKKFQKARRQKKTSENSGSEKKKIFIYRIKFGSTNRETRFGRNAENEIGFNFSKNTRFNEIGARKKSRKGVRSGQ